MNGSSGVVLNGLSGAIEIFADLAVASCKRQPVSDQSARSRRYENPLPPNLIDRAIYFATLNPANQTIDTSGTMYHSDLPQAMAMAPLLPGRYAVVGGSGDDTGPNGVFETTFGRRSDAVEGSRGTLKTDQTRRIVLSPGPNPNTNQVFIKSNKTSGADDPFQRQKFSRRSRLSLIGYLIQ